MNIRQRKIPMSAQMRKALDDVGGEPLRGSGFENETPETDFRSDNNDAEVAPPA
jgi:hypothetical protein